MQEFNIGGVNGSQGGSYQGTNPGITQPVQSNSIDQFVQAVGVFAPAVRRYAVVDQAEISEEQTRQVLQNLHQAEAENKANTAALVKDGSLALGANPYAAKAARTFFMQGIAKRMGDEIAKEYETSHVKNGTPDEVNAWAREQYAKKARDQGFNDPHDPEFLEGFTSVRERMVDNLVGYHSRVAADRTVKDLNDSIRQRSMDIASSGSDTAAQEISQDILQQAFMTGMSPRDAMERSLEGIITGAVSAGDLNMLNVAKQIETPDGNGGMATLYSREWAKTAIDKAEEHILAQQGHQAIRDKQIADARKKQLEDGAYKGAADLLISKDSDVATVGQKYDAFLEEMRKGGVDGKTLFELRDLQDKALAANKKRAEMGDPTADFNFPTHMENMDAIRSGQITSRQQLNSIYRANPDIMPFWEEAQKEFNVMERYAKDEADMNLKGLRLTLIDSVAFKNAPAAKQLSIESQYRSYMDAWIEGKRKAGQQVDAAEAIEYGSKTIDKLNKMYLEAPRDASGGTVNVRDPQSVETVRDLYREKIDSQKNEKARAETYNATIATVSEAATSIKTIGSTLESLGLDKYGDKAVELNEAAIRKVSALAQVSNDPEAIAASRALATVSSVAIQRGRWEANTKALGGTSVREGKYSEVPQNLEASSQILLMRAGKIVNLKAGEKKGYTPGLYFVDPEDSMKFLLDHIETEIKKTKLQIEQPVNK